MSHFPIVVKVRADSEEDAFEKVREELEETCTNGNRAGFDYVSDGMDLLTMDNLPKGIKSFEQLEEEWGTKARQKEIDSCMGQIRDSVRMSLAQKYLPLKDIPLLLKSKDYTGNVDTEFGNFLEQRLKSSTEGELPRNFLEFMNAVIDILSFLKPQERYLLGIVDDLRECERNDRYYLLNTLNNQFADLTDETEKAGKNIYYILADRHA